MFYIIAKRKYAFPSEVWFVLKRLVVCFEHIVVSSENINFLEKDDYLFRKYDFHLKTSFSESI